MSVFRTTTLRLTRSLVCLILSTSLSFQKLSLHLPTLSTQPCLKHTTTRYASATATASLTHTPPPQPSSSSSPADETLASATKAYTFKRTQRRKFPFPVIPTPAPLTAEEAVTNIIYNTNSTTLEDKNKRYLLTCLVQDEPGVLSRVSGILAARGFNIDSLVVSKTEIKDLSRMTVVLKGADTNVEQARRQLEDLVPVWAALDYTSVKLIERELLLVKVSTLGPDHIKEEEMESTDVNHSAISSMLHSPSLFEYHHQMLTQTHERLRALTELSRLFNASVVDVCETSVIIELAAKSERIDAFIRLVNPFGIIEASRSGTMAIPRSVAAYPETDDETETKNAGSAVDATMLPPG